jgi:tetratricopeptide (TPR) repeat protein
MSNTTLELQSARQVFRLAEESGNVQGRLWGRYDMAVAFARAGDLQSAADWIEQGRVCKGDNKMMATGVVFLAAQGFVHLQSSNYESARLVLEESWQTTAKQKVVNEYIVQALPWLIESYAGPNWLDDSRTPPMKRLRLLCQQAWVFLWLYPNLKPQIERARGRVYAALGKRKKAMRCLERSVRFAAKIGADYDLAKASLDLAAVKEEGRREMRSEAIRLLKKQESVIPYAESWLLGDQYDPDVVAGPREEERDDGSLHGRSESQ